MQWYRDYHTKRTETPKNTLWADRVKVWETQRAQRTSHQQMTAKLPSTSPVASQRSKAMQWYRDHHIKPVETPKNTLWADRAKVWERKAEQARNRLQDTKARIARKNIKRDNTMQWYRDHQSKLSETPKSNYWHSNNRPV